MREHSGCLLTRTCWQRFWQGISPKKTKTDYQRCRSDEKHHVWGDSLSTSIETPRNLPLLQLPKGSATSGQRVPKLRKRSVREGAKAPILRRFTNNHRTTEETEWLFLLEESAPTDLRPRVRDDRMHHVCRNLQRSPNWVDVAGVEGICYRWSEVPSRLPQVRFGFTNDGH